MSVKFAYRSVAALSSAWVAMSCSFAVSADYLTGGADGGAPVVDAATSDAPISVDATTAPDAPANPVTECPPNAIVCDDFERETVAGTWASVVTLGGTIAIAPASPKGRVLKSQVPAGAADGYVRAKAVVPLSNAKGVTMSQDVRLEAPNEGGVHIGELTFVLPDSQHTVFPYYLSNYGLVIGEFVCSSGSCTYTQTQPVPFASAQWRRVTLDVDLTASPARLTLLIDGATVRTANSALQFSAGSLEFAAGASYFDGPHGAFDLLIDDFVVVSR